MFLGTLRTSTGATGQQAARGRDWVSQGRLTGLGQLDNIELLTLLGSGAVGGDERVHEGLEVGAPPLGKAVADVPVPLGLAVAQAADGGQALVQALLEAVNLVVLGLEIVAGQLEECICNLQHEDVGMIVLVADEDALAGSPHAMFHVVLLQALQPSHDGRVLLRLGLLYAEGVVGQRVDPDRLGLVGLEGEGFNWWHR